MTLFKDKFYLLKRRALYKDRGNYQNLKLTI